MSQSYRLLCFFVVFFAASVAHSQSEISALSGTGVERQRIEASRADIERAFAAARAACYQKFFVNSCLDDADEQRRLGLSKLRRQEVLLNDSERKQKAAAQLRRLEEKARPGSSPPDANVDADADALATPARRDQAIKSTQPKPSASHETPLRPPLQSGKSVERAAINRDKADARAAKAANEAEQTREFVERQNKAQQRRNEHEQAQKSRTKPAEQPLPTSP